MRFAWGDRHDFAVPEGAARPALFTHRVRCKPAWPCSRANGFRAMLGPTTLSYCGGLKNGEGRKAGASATDVDRVTNRPEEEHRPSTAGMAAYPFRAFSADPGRRRK